MSESSGLASAVETARRIIENGGETYRAEELLFRAARASGVADADGFVIPTGVIASGGEGGSSCALVRRIERRGLDLGEICRIEDLVRDLESGKLDAAEFDNQLRRPAMPSRIEPLKRLAASAFIAGFFALLFGGGEIDFGLALLIGPLVALLGIMLAKMEIPAYFANVAGAALAVGAAAAAAPFFEGVRLEALTAGPLMLLVPGIAITNSVRDTIEGDLVSGLARGIEAFLLAAALAIGAGFALKLSDVIEAALR